MADPRIDRLEQQLSNLGNILENMMKTMDVTNSKVDNLCSKENNDKSGECSNTKNKGKGHSGAFNSATPKFAKLDFPRYDGDEDPTSWIYRVEQFFDYQQTSEEEKISLAAYHLDGAAQMWYQLFKESEELMSWENSEIRAVRSIWSNTI